MDSFRDPGSGFPGATPPPVCHWFHSSGCILNLVFCTSREMVELPSLEVFKNSGDVALRDIVSGGRDGVGLMTLKVFSNLNNSMNLLGGQTPPWMHVSLCNPYLVNFPTLQKTEKLPVLQKSSLLKSRICSSQHCALYSISSQMYSPLGLFYCLSQ